MNLHTLKPAKGAVKKTKRIGRGQGSGRGGTSTKGHKGAQSRAGYKKRAGFEGGQMPLQRRTPKRGFKNPFRIEYRVFNLDRLQMLAENNGWASVGPEQLISQRLVKKGERVKILAGGEFKSKLEISAHAVSSPAQKAIETAGGKVNIIS